MPKGAYKDCVLKTVRGVTPFFEIQASQSRAEPRKTTAAKLHGGRCSIRRPPETGHMNSFFSTLLTSNVAQARRGNYTSD
jgi:hypothetical protein